MTVLIAHRGLTRGPDPHIENTHSAITQARQQGYDVEIDVWYCDGSWWLGHDQPQYALDLAWLRTMDRQDNLDMHHVWIHAKDIKTLYQLRLCRWGGHVFFHENDPVTLTTSGYIWTFPGQSLTPLSVCVMPESAGMLDTIAQVDVWGICSDYIDSIALQVNQK